MVDTEVIHLISLISLVVKTTLKTSEKSNRCHFLVGGWATLLKNMKVNWDD